ncbi:MAG TPA: response regulator [Opitutaceae bacterium]|nr:response regulator [Opitutaceae bacterium]
MPLRILVVDDDPISLKLTTAVLLHAGFEVDSARDAETALVRVRERPLDVVLLDIQLPTMDGLTLAGIIKSDERTRHLRLIALTAYAMKRDEARALAAGCDGYLSKPIDTTLLPLQIAQYEGLISAASTR